MNIIFVHGFSGGRYEYQPLIRYLKRHGINNCHEFVYIKNTGKVSLIETAKDLQKFIQNKKLKNIVFIGISQGGIISSFCNEYLLKKPVKKCITICTPFDGSYSAYFMRRIGAMELRPNNLLIKQLMGKLKRSKTKYYGVWNPLDLMVLPGWSGKQEFMKKTKMVIAPLHQLTFWTFTTKRFMLDCITS
jgi:triacylglycerol lipase